MTLHLTCAAFVAALGMGGPARAQQYPREGPYDFTSCYAGTTSTITFSPTHTAMTSEYMGTTRSEPPGGLFDKLTFRCVGFNASFDGKVSGSRACESVDKDGDKYLVYLNVVGDGRSTRETVAGTGKFSGLTSAGSAVAMGPFPTLRPGTIQDCARQTGTYRFK